MPVYSLRCVIYPLSSWGLALVAIVCWRARFRVLVWAAWCWVALSWGSLSASRLFCLHGFTTADEVLVFLCKRVSPRRACCGAMVWTEWFRDVSSWGLFWRRNYAAFATSLLLLKFWYSSVGASAPISMREACWFDDYPISLNGNNCKFAK